jgi:uridylate kinase
MAEYKRVLIKLSGGALASKAGESLGVDNLEHITNEIISLTKIGVEVSVVVGGGNILEVT